MDQELTTRLAREVAVASTVSALGWNLTLIGGAFSGSWLAACLLLVISAAITVWLHRAARVSRRTVLATGAAVLVATIVFGSHRETAEGTHEPFSPAEAAASAHILDSAIALGKEGHTEEAIEALRRLVAREPSNAPAMANLCGFELEAGRIAAAAATCRDATAQAPSNWLAHYNEACAFALTARPDAALTALRKALELVEADPRAHLSRAELARQANHDAMLRILHGTPPFVALVGVR